MGYIKADDNSFSDEAPCVACLGILQDKAQENVITKVC